MPEKYCQLFSSLQELGLKTNYGQDPVFAHNVNQIAALAFLDPNDVSQGFDDFYGSRSLYRHITLPTPLCRHITLLTYHFADTTLPTYHFADTTLPTGTLYRQVHFACKICSYPECECVGVGEGKGAHALAVTVTLML